MEKEMEKETETKSETKSDTLKAATTALVQGKRHLFIKEVPQAVTALGEACRLFSEAVGIFSIDSADAHYYYGKSLLENARIDLNVFESQPTGTNATKSGEEESDDEDEEMEEDDEEEDAESESSAKAKNEKDEDISVDADKVEDVEPEDKVKNGLKPADAKNTGVPSPKAEINPVKSASDDEKPTTSSEAGGEASVETKNEKDEEIGVNADKTEDVESEDKVKNGSNPLDAENLAVPNPQLEVKPEKSASEDEKSTSSAPSDVASSKTKNEEKEKTSMDTDKTEDVESENKVKNGLKLVDPESMDAPSTKMEVMPEKSASEDEKSNSSAPSDVASSKTKNEEVEETSMDMDTDKTEDVESENKVKNGLKPVDPESLDALSPKMEVKPGTSAGDDEKPSTSSGTDGEDDPDVTVPEEDEPTNLELAWEVLEVSKVSYTRLVEEAALKFSEANESDKTDEKKELKKILKDYRNKMALVHSMLGEVATESEQYPQAVEEINTALTILREIEEYDNREIAQCYFQLGIAYSFDKKFDDAITSFKKAVELIQKRIENLETKYAAVKVGNEIGVEETKNVDLAEIEELKALLPELQEKITDTLDAEKDAVRVNEEEKQEQELILRASPVKNPNPPVVNDISHLVKKKKKAEDLPEEEPPSKKICTEPDSTNASKCSNGENGNHEAVNGSTVTAE